MTQNKTERRLKSDMENRTVDFQEKWESIESINIPEGQFIVTNFVQNSDGTKVSLDDEKFVVEIFFDGIPLLIRQAIEGVRMRTWGEVQAKYNDKWFFHNHFFFEVTNSLLTNWVAEEGCGFYETSKIKHYCIVTSEEMIDILAEFEPIVNVSNR
jgi:hypothetical protein